MNRETFVFSALKKEGKGLEIGPSHNPIAPKKRGFNVEILDHLSKNELISKYREHNVNLSNIEDVDYIWKGESYSKLIGKKNHYDWAIASHLIEHTPDLISFLNDCSEILNDSGVLSLVIPDKRYCFDHFRPHTGISKIIDSHYNKNKIHTPGTAAEYFLNVVSKNGGTAWDLNTKGEYAFVHNATNAQDSMKQILNDNAYLDLHSWCFTPNSFRLIIHDLNLLGFINLKEVIWHPTNGCEFYISLSRNGEGIGVNSDRLTLLKLIEAELNNNS